mmetsp:Transcript_24419/g.61802  ORF Transcript_24419/g.61802 Transcript_24419/m.61802 type:complete len:379 (-) Transcript_24419:2066-3202(-)
MPLLATSCMNSLFSLSMKLKCCCTSLSLCCTKGWTPQYLTRHRRYGAPAARTCGLASCSVSSIILVITRSRTQPSPSSAGPCPALAHSSAAFSASLAWSSYADGSLSWHSSEGEVYRRAPATHAIASPTHSWSSSTLCSLDAAKSLSRHAETTASDRHVTHRLPSACAAASYTLLSFSLPPRMSPRRDTMRVTVTPPSSPPLPSSSMDPSGTGSAPSRPTSPTALQALVGISILLASPMAVYSLSTTADLTESSRCLAADATRYPRARRQPWRCSTEAPSSLSSDSILAMMPEAWSRVMSSAMWPSTEATSSLVSSLLQNRKDSSHCSLLPYSPATMSRRAPKRSISATKHAFARAVSLTLLLAPVLRLLDSASSIRV